MWVRLKQKARGNAARKCPNLEKVYKRIFNNVWQRIPFMLPQETDTHQTEEANNINSSFQLHAEEKWVNTRKSHPCLLFPSSLSFLIEAQLVPGSCSPRLNTLLLENSLEKGFSHFLLICCLSQETCPQLPVYLAVQIFFLGETNLWNPPSIIKLYLLKESSEFW